MLNHLIIYVQYVFSLAILDFIFYDSLFSSLSFSLFYYQILFIFIIFDQISLLLYVLRIVCLGLWGINLTKTSFLVFNIVNTIIMNINTIFCCNYWLNWSLSWSNLDKFKIVSFKATIICSSDYLLMIKAAFCFSSLRHCCFSL